MKQKKVELYRWILTNYAKEGDKILDTHLGSGSIAIACYYMGFDLVGSELDAATGVILAAKNSNVYIIVRHYTTDVHAMPKMTADRIEFIPEDRNIIGEKSAGITASGYSSLFNSAISTGDTKGYFKFLEEIAEKDPDIGNTLGTRSSYVTAKEWQIEDEEGNPDSEDATRLAEALREIEGDCYDGLNDVAGLIQSMLGSSFLTGLSFSEIVTDGERIRGFQFIPCHFLTFENSVYYPKLYTQDKPDGEAFNREKLISHYLTKSKDPARGYLGNAVAWQYVFKRATMEERENFERKYGKGFLLVNMPGSRDDYLENWKAAETLIENYATTDGAIFDGDVEVDFKESMQADGDYFFNAEDKYESNITKLILGQESTSSVEDSNRSTAAVHMEVLEQRTIDDMAAIEDTLNSQLLPHVKQLLGISEDTNLYFKFVVSDMEATLDEDIDDESALEDNTEGTTKPTQDEDETNE